ncbi:RES family NAD+ phosphorylase [Mitsuaria sp. GD03876]|uniref:RES family NAD+ phosphorylase n=1 Tax=Mitsuaria sp. GD03876 TaxID=2975399 RepID=UPI00244CCFA5|nr:RES family NAD+ phosphorylase [Mitsuaria sp. GD03876]MDH0866838.1 RES family NAD+ phosphorylase [Mitsuaria sp. GD03876]
MTVQLWRIATDTRDYLAEDLGGKGAEITGGRWNRPGRAVVYTSVTASLSCLETVVHLQDNALPLNRYLIRIDVPDDVWALKAVLRLEDLNPGWSAIPEGRISLDLGDGWLAANDTPLLVVPSVIVPEESNVLINPTHPAVRHIVAVKLRAWHYDRRLA